jgi:hypothetical protein
MSVATAIAAVGTVLAAKSAIEGIQEGNLLKAVVSGVGAYYGMSTLQAGAAAASTNVAGAAASDTAVNAATDTALQATADQVATTTVGANGASGIASGVNAGISSAAENATKNALAGMGEQATGSTGLLDTLSNWGSSASQWAEKNPMAASGIVQMGGGLLQGYSQEKQSDEEMKALEESRRRRQLTGNTSFMQRQYFNPTTGAFEVA